MTTVLEGGEGSASGPGRSLPPGMSRYPLYRRMGGPQGWPGQVRKISPQPEFDPWTVQSVASRYTYHAIPAPCTFGRITDSEKQKCSENNLSHCYFITDPTWTV
jgi:hypothetical protein